MASDQRLHPLSFLFGIAQQLKAFVLPVILLFFAGSQGWGGGGWQLWAPLFAIPYALVSLGRYFSFRYRYEPNEMVVRTGFLFRNERHIPYARIQNLDAVQNVFHRLLDVVEVRVETGGGEEPEAKLSVLPVAAYEEMRRRVFAGREAASGNPAAAAPAGAADAADAAKTAGEDTGRTLLRLSPRDLMLWGFIQNRGIVLVGAAFGLLWELRIADRYLGRVLGGDSASRSVVRELFRSLFRGGGFPVGRIALALAAFAGFLVLVRLISMGWALVRLHGFQVTLAGEDLRTRYGLLTRVTATIPRRRIQTLTILEGPLHHLFRRASVRVDTAGGGGGGEGEEKSERQREWLAPIVRRGELPGFLREVLPELDLAAAHWQGMAPRAFRRKAKSWLLIAGAVSLVPAVFLRWWDVAFFALLAAWALAAARIYVRHLGWAVTESAILFRSGWLWRKLTVVRFTRIQAVAMHESPFDRRAGMARVRVDTAGAGSSSHRVDIPYLSRQTASELCGLLTRQAARTEFRW
ncbi:MAG TPA: PH domain-containing protein [Thermoanaerobaculia bacterium]|nr:PH domain-containing protein [Thermoanaerobaculia bacterium]